MIWNQGQSLMKVYILTQNTKCKGCNRFCMLCMLRERYVHDKKKGRVGWPIITNSVWSPFTTLHFFFRSGQHETLNIFNSNDPVNFCLLVSQSESSIRQFKKCQHDELVLYIIYRKILSGALN